MLGSVGGDGWLAVSQSCGVWSGQEQVLLHPAHLGTGPPPPPNIISILHNTAPGHHGKGEDMNVSVGNSDSICYLATILILIYKLYKGRLPKQVPMYICARPASC